MTFENTSTSAVTGVLYPSISSVSNPTFSEAMMLPYAKHNTTAVLGGSPNRCTLASSGMIGYGLSLIPSTAPLRYRRETLTGINTNPTYPVYW